MGSEFLMKATCGFSEVAGCTKGQLSCRTHSGLDTESDKNRLMHWQSCGPQCQPAQSLGCHIPDNSPHKESMHHRGFWGLAIDSLCNRAGVSAATLVRTEECPASRLVDWAGLGWAGLGHCLTALLLCEYHCKASTAQFSIMANAFPG